MAPWNYIFIYSKEPKEPGALPIELQGLNPGLKSTNKQVIVEHSVLWEQRLRSRHLLTDL